MLANYFITTFFFCHFHNFQAKIHYLDIIAGLPSYGAKCFSTNARDGIERVLLVSPRFGLSQIPGIRNSVVSFWESVKRILIFPLYNIRKKQCLQLN